MFARFLVQVPQKNVTPKSSNDQKKLYLDYDFFEDVTKLTL